MRSELTVREGRALMNLSNVYRAANKSATTNEGALADECVFKLYRKLRKHGHKAKAGWTFGPEPHPEATEEETMGRKVAVDLTDDERVGAYHVLALSIKSGSPFQITNADMEEIVLPIADKLRMARTIYKDLKLEDSKLPTIPVDEEVKAEDDGARKEEKIA